MRALAGLRLWPADFRAAGASVAAALAGVVALILLLDLVLFRTHLSADSVRFYTSPLFPRLAQTCWKVVQEEGHFRLLIMTALIMPAGWAWRGRPPAAVFWIAIVATQFADVGGLVLGDPLYATLRFWVVGCVWGWLYWKFGWLAATAGHLGARLVLDPLLFLILG
jgi:hypothetical protein